MNVGERLAIPLLVAHGFEAFAPLVFIDLLLSSLLD